MLNGIYSAAAGMAAQQSRIDALSNDIANVNTVGYKSERVGFRDLVYTDGNVQVGAGAASAVSGRTESQGVLTAANDPLNVAVEGDGFFQVRLEDGTIALTRAGNFRLDATGTLVTQSGERVEPRIVVPAGSAPEDVSIASDGTVTTSQGQRLGRLQLVTVTAPSGLAPAGDGLFAPTAASGATRPATGKIRQGMVEAANVDLGRAMVELVEAQRGFQLVSRAIQTGDQLLEIANGIRR